MCSEGPLNRYCRSRVVVPAMGEEHMEVFLFPLKRGLDLKTVVNGGAAVNTALTEQQCPFLWLGHKLAWQQMT